MPAWFAIRELNVAWCSNIAKIDADFDATFRKQEMLRHLAARSKERISQTSQLKQWSIFITVSIVAIIVDRRTSVGLIVAALPVRTGSGYDFLFVESTILSRLSINGRLCLINYPIESTKKKRYIFEITNFSFETKKHRFPKRFFATVYCRFETSWAV